jgi:hypothetical protein
MGVVRQACNLKIQEVKAGGLKAWGQPGLQSAFKVSLSYIVRPYLKKQKKKKKKIEHARQQENMNHIWRKGYQSVKTNLDLTQIQS